MNTRRTFSRIDVIVAVGVVMLLAANLIPALPSARELARKQFCRANLPAIGAALQSYHEAYGVLPLAAPIVAWTAAIARTRRSGRICLGVESILRPHRVSGQASETGTFERSGTSPPATRVREFRVERSWIIRPTNRIPRSGQGAGDASCRCAGGLTLHSPQPACGYRFRAPFGDPQVRFRSKNKSRRAG